MAIVASMKHHEFPGQVCSVARSLEIVGEWWTLLIVREAFFGTERFSDFEINLGISKNILTERLSKLVEAEILERTQLTGRGNPVCYRLTDSGRDLLTIIVALMQWGDRWINRRCAPVRIIERETGNEVAELVVTGNDGKTLSLRDLDIVPGPGADDAIRKRFGRKPSWPSSARKAE
jgi:DNA-binding HxlR family transcriptional regulator